MVESTNERRGKVICYLKRGRPFADFHFIAIKSSTQSPLLRSMDAALLYTLD